ncbi:hypothetical protein T06_9074 [Trichinella sp. T6]|nr:hypothetical protein T06_9074 [Trichinella sp. T6]
MLCMLLYLYGVWKLTGVFSIVVIANFQAHQTLKKNITLTSSEYDISSDDAVNTSDAEDEEVSISAHQTLKKKYLCFLCSDHFVLNVASVSIEFVPDCSCIVQYYFKVLIYFIHGSITLTSSEYDISSDDAIHQMLKTKKYLFLFLFGDECINIIHF